MADPDPKDIIIEELKDYLRYKEECGERLTELDTEAVSALFSSTHPAARPSRPAPAAATPAARAMAAPSSAARATVPSDPGTLESIAKEAAACRNCELFQQRTQVVPGQGNPHSPDVMFIGEAPGADEDRKGIAFIGRAGQLLTKMIAAMGYSRDEVFIANICKCRPPGNRTPTPKEMAACIPFLKRQISIVKPKAIVALGNTAILGLLGTTGITRLRGNWRTFEGYPLMPTYHPAFLLRCPGGKRDAWHDLQAVMAKIKELKKS